MEDKKSPNKIKRKTQIFYLDEHRLIKWSDIKHLDLQDNDIIHSAWEEGYDEGEGGYVGEITRMVEETDEQFEKRQHSLELEAKWAKERRYESYLRLKKEFENEQEKK